MAAIDEGEIDAIVAAVRELDQALQALRAEPADPGPPRVQAIVALDALEGARRRLARDMVKEMQADGVEQFKVGHWTVCARPGRMLCNIHDRDAIPPAYLKPTPDLTKIRRLLDEHPDTNWASLEQGEPYLEIRVSRR